MTRHIAGPALLIAIGMLFLMNNVGWHLPLGYVIGRFWPLLLIGVGLAQVLGSLAGRGSLPGGLMVLTVGFLFLLQEVFGIGFGDTWPVLLIAAGAIGLLRGLLGPSLFRHGFVRGGRR